MDHKTRCNRLCGKDLPSSDFKQEMLSSVNNLKQFQHQIHFFMPSDLKKLFNQAASPYFKYSILIYILEINESDPSTLNFNFNSNTLKEINISHYVRLK